MPIYEYECEKCGKVFEAWQQMSDKPLKKCDFCSGKVHKLISRSSFHLKGSGWYATDYAGKKASSTAGTTGVGGNAKKAGTKKCTTAKKTDAAGSKAD